jgi:crotonobetainyl-CoA:carnitine CoA-transferase CaiB-like acyl-CoA transferase
MSGIMDRTRAGDEPVKTGMSSADVISANFAVSAVLTALIHRDACGAGQFIDVSMQDVAAWSMQLTWNGATPIRDRCSVRRARDGYVVIPGDADAIPADAVAALDRAQCQAHWPGRAWPVQTLGEAMRSPLSGAPVLEVADERGRSWPVLVNPIRLSRTPLVHPPIISDLDGDRADLLGD